MDRNEVFRAFAAELAEMIVEHLRLRETKQLYTVREAAEYLGCSEEQIDNFAKTGRLRKRMIDRRPRYDIRDLSKFVDSARSIGRR